MKTKVVLAALGVAALGVAPLLASPALARPASHNAAPAVVNVPGDAHGAVQAPTSGPYSPSIPTPPHGLNPDFQDGSRG